jgi:CPA2 family monovalent cation:H+ antiporter-2
MEHSDLTSLMIVVAFAFLVPISLHHFKLRAIPVVVAEIIVGLVIGKSGFNLVAEDPWLELLSLFGFIYLMFLSGLEIDFKSFKKKRNTLQSEVNPVLAAFLVFIAIMVVSTALSFFLVSIKLASDPFLMVIIIATISLGVVVPVLKEQRIIDSSLGQIILLTAVIADLVTMIMLAIYISSLSQDLEKMLLLILFFVLVVGVYFFAKHFSKGKVFEVLTKGTVQIGTRAVFALILLFVVLSDTFNVEIILGAFLAGVIVSLLAPNKEFVHQLDSFGYGFLIPIFFVMVGVNLDLWSLFNDITLLLFIPMLLVAIFISKMVPAIILRRWFTWTQVWSSGVLLASTLSLVIATATVAQEVGIITETMEGALILTAVLSCLISPIIFSKIFPKVVPKKRIVAIVGANHITLPVSQDLKKEGYEVELYSAQPPKDESKEEKYSRFPLIEVTDLEIDTLTAQGVFNADLVVAGTMDDNVNLRLAHHAKKIGIERIIIRAEDPDLHEDLQNEGFVVMSTLYASRTLMKALIEHPSAVKLITHHDDSIQEVQMNNPSYHNTYLKDMPFIGEALVMRIYRGESFVIPHGSTQIQLNDRLLVSGDVQHILAMKRELE